MSFIASFLDTDAAADQLIITVSVALDTVLVLKCVLSFQIIFYYGAKDHWCPVQYYLDMKQDFPHGDIRLCEREFRHAFVLDAGSEVSKMVAEWIHGDLRT